MTALLSFPPPFFPSVLESISHAMELAGGTNGVAEWVEAGAMDLMFMCPLNSYVETLIPNMIVFGGAQGGG